MKNMELEDFTPAQKEEIMKRDGYRCVVCGKGISCGVELNVDRIMEKDFVGEATIENGQTLCSSCNFEKNKYGQMEAAKKMFARFYAKAKSIDDINTKNFCAEILEVFEKTNVNEHIVRKR